MKHMHEHPTQSPVTHEHTKSTFEHSHGLYYEGYSTYKPAFDYEPWRHGGWYVGNVRYPSGAVGCVSRNYSDKKWRIVCDSRRNGVIGGAGDYTYASRDEAAKAERDLIAAGVLA